MTTVKLKPVDRVLTRVAYCASGIAGKTGSKLFGSVDRVIVQHMFDKYVPVSIRAAGKMHACLSFDTIQY